MGAVDLTREMPTGSLAGWTPVRGTVTSRADGAGQRGLHRAPQDGAQFKTYGLRLWGFHLVCRVVVDFEYLKPWTSDQRIKGVHMQVLLLNIYRDGHTTFQRKLLHPWTD